MLSRPYAFGCILRLRTSSEFKPGHSVSDSYVLMSLLSRVYHVFYLQAQNISCSMVISSQIHTTRMFNTLFAAILLQHMLMTLILRAQLGFPGIHVFLRANIYCDLLLAKYHWNLTTVSICIKN
jgi:hypothetical protein